jgi:hypothetical protein
VEAEEQLKSNGDKMEDHSVTKQQLGMFRYYRFLVLEGLLDRGILRLQMSCVPKWKMEDLIFHSFETLGMLLYPPTLPLS